MSETDKPLEQVQTSVVDCGDSLDIRVVEEIKTGLIHALETGKAITLKSEAVERIDTAGLQLLCALVNDAKAKDLVVQWESPSQTIIEAAQLTGLTNTLGL